MGGLKIPDVIIPMSNQMAELMKEAESDINGMDLKVDYESGFGEFNKMEDGKVKKVKVGRNDPCPCGSGKKYKHCHGRAEKRTVKKEEKEWNSYVLFAPESMSGEATGSYYFYGTDEFIILSKEKINSDEAQMVNCYVRLCDDGPHHIAIYNDMLYAASKKFPGKIEEVDGLIMCLGLVADEEQIIVHIR